MLVDFPPAPPSQRSARMSRHKFRLQLLASTAMHDISHLLRYGPTTPQGDASKQRLRTGTQLECAAAGLRIFNSLRRSSRYGGARHASLSGSAACAWLEHRHAFVARWPSNGRQGTAACHLFLFQDPDASANDKFVALELLKNANVAAGMVLPSCQDTGTAIIMGKRGQQVHRNKSAAQPSHAAATRDRRCELAAE
jgi:hypothetical protein